MVLYFANPCGEVAVPAMREGLLGYIDTPSQGNRRPEGLVWCADNGCFGRGWPGEGKWLEWLDSAYDKELCEFATAPDVVGNAEATLERSLPHLPRIRELGYPAAFVAQDGLTSETTPWDEFDVLFIGGSTEFKLGETAKELTHEARSKGLKVHMGRVNSLKRYRIAASWGCTSVDGTYLTFGPRVNLPKLLKWVDVIKQEFPNERT